MMEVCTLHTSPPLPFLIASIYHRNLSLLVKNNEYKKKGIVLFWLCSGAIFQEERRQGLACIPTALTLQYIFFSYLHILHKLSITLSKMNDILFDSLLCTAQ